MPRKDGDPADSVATGNDAVLVLEERKKRRQEAIDSGQAPRGPKAGPGGKGAQRAAVRQLPEDDDDAVTANGMKPYDGPIPAPAKSARLRARHWGVMASFILMVIVPVVISGWYLWERATDRYVSTAGFSVRTESSGSALELLGGMVNVGSSSSSDTDILYEFIQSQEMVTRINEQIDLRAVWAKADPETDPVFAYHPPGTIEDMLDYWNRMVTVYNDTTTGLMTLKVQAFTPEDAQMIAQLVYNEGSEMINRLSDLAQEDATRLARVELDESVEQLKNAREAVKLFRNQYQIVDPSADIQSQLGILNSLQAELASTLIDLDILQQTTAESDPRFVQAQRRKEVIEARIADERAKFGIGSGVATEDRAAGNQDQALVEMVGEYERLMVDLDFAEHSYAAARISFDAAVSESRRQSRYLAAHVSPTKAEKAEEPLRFALLGLVALFTFMIWSLATLSAYALKDRR